VRRLAGLLWGVSAARTHAVGKGLVMNGFTMEDALAMLKLQPDLETKAADSLLFLHRTTSSGEDIYFVSNQSAKKVSAAPAFRVQGKVPMLFDPLLGSVRDLPVYTQQDAVTKVPLELEKYQSYFIVFRTGRGGSRGKANFPPPLKKTEVSGPWTVYFDSASRGPIAPVVFPQLTDWALDVRDSIRYYSGRAVYRNRFSLPGLLPGRSLYLDLGMVAAMAKVKVNGAYVGGAWTPPYRVDITRAAKAGTNTVEIEVVNTWVNRMIGDSRLPVNERRTWSNVNPYKPESACFSAGLLGPVKVLTIEQY
jgi:hypothetical protein